MAREKINWESKAALAWPILCAAAATTETLYYKQLGGAIGVHHRNVRWVLGVIQEYCMNAGLPPLTALVISKKDGKPGRGFIAGDRDAVDYELQAVRAFDWSLIDNPFTIFLDDGETISDLVDRIISNPSRSVEVYRLVRDRGMIQTIFKRGLLKAYENQCAMCGVTFADALDGAHIKPYAKCKPEEKINITNGLLLCASHHKLFDRGYFSISPDFKISYYDAKMKDGYYTADDKALTGRLHGKKLRLPKDKKHWPVLPTISN